MRYIAVRILRFFDSSDDLEVFARIVEVADGLYAPSDIEGFLDGINQVIIGTPYKKGIRSAGMYSSNRENDRCVAVGRKCAARAQGTDENGNPIWEAPLLGSRGWRFLYGDGSNQAFHFWSAFVSAVEHPELGFIVTTSGNIWHEGVEYVITRLQGGTPKGHSVQDFLLTQVGIGLGSTFGRGFIPRDQLGFFIRNVFSSPRD